MTGDHAGSQRGSHGNEDAGSERAGSSAQINAQGGARAGLPDGCDVAVAVVVEISRHQRCNGTGAGGNQRAAESPSGAKNDSHISILKPDGEVGKAFMIEIGGGLR